MTNLNLFVASIALLFASCHNTASGDDAESDDDTPGTVAAASAARYDPLRGEGKWTADNVHLPDTINHTWARSGENISTVKCMACHKLTDEALVGPGWKDVTKRRSPQWILNFITNPDPMLDKDPRAQAMLAICLVRMPDQNLSDDEARDILEFMRANDAKKK